MYIFKEYNTPVTHDTQNSLWNTLRPEASQEWCDRASNMVINCVRHRVSGTIVALVNHWKSTTMHV